MPDEQEREFWLQLRRGFCMLAASGDTETRRACKLITGAIDKRYGLGEHKVNSAQK